MVGKKRSIQYVENNAEGNLSVPPGFVSLTSLTLKKIVAGCDAATDVECKRMSIGDPLSKSDIEKFKTSLIRRPWIHGQLDGGPQQDGSGQNEVHMEDPVGPCLPKGVIRGCPNCHDCVKVTAKWHPEESCLPVLEDAPVFRPTEEEFKETLKYIADIRPKAENYGICRIVPPPSWRSPCLLEDKKTWETSKFNTHVQKINDLQNLYFQRKLSKVHKKTKVETVEEAATGGLESCNECVGDSEETKSVTTVSEFESGPDFTLKSFKKYADDFKAQYFRENDMTAGHDQREPLIVRIEGEYWRIIENPSEELEVLLGTDMASQTLGKAFSIVATPAKDSVKYSEYLKSGWNLNNTPNLSGSLLPFGCYNSSVSVPQMCIGMCFASQCWRNEDHHLYSLSYMHLGSPKVWYGIPGRYGLKFVEVVKKLFPQLSKHPKLLYELVAQLSPSMLMSEGVPVYRCLQNPFEFVVTFPGAYHSEFSCGFNCSQAVCLAPLDWLPHGQNIIEVYARYCLKTSMSYDKLLLRASMEAVASRWDSFAIKKDSSDSLLWKLVCGKNGMLTKLLKSRVANEGLRRKHICKTLMSRASNESDGSSKRECSICLYDLYLSAVGCRCSPTRYSCLRHAKQFCSCSWSAKHVFFRYRIEELNLLVEALEGDLKAMHSWAKRKVRPDTLQQLNPCNKGPAALTEQISNGSLCELNGAALYRIRIPALNRDNEENKRSDSATTFDSESSWANKDQRSVTRISPPAVTSPQIAHHSASNLSTPFTGRKIKATPLALPVVILSSDDEEEPP